MPPRLSMLTLGKTERLLWIGGDFVEVPAHGVEAELVKQRRREDVVPQRGMGVGKAVGVPQIGGAIGPVEEGAARWEPSRWCRRRDLAD